MPPHRFLSLFFRLPIVLVGVIICELPTTTCFVWFSERMLSFTVILPLLHNTHTWTDNTLHSNPHSHSRFLSFGAHRYRYLLLAHYCMYKGPRTGARGTPGKNHTDVPVHDRHALFCTRGWSVPSSLNSSTRHPPWAGAGGGGGGGRGGGRPPRHPPPRPCPSSRPASRPGTCPRSWARAGDGPAASARPRGLR